MIGAEMPDAPERVIEVIREGAAGRRDRAGRQDRAGNRSVANSDSQRDATS